MMEMKFFGVCAAGLLWTTVLVLGQDYENVAIGKTYHQISFYRSDRPAGNAANSKTDGNFNNVNNCIHTNVAADDTAVPKDAFPWWEVDLGRIYPVQDITIWERDGFSSRLFPFVITVDDAICVMMTSDPDLSSRQNSLKCTSVLYGRKVRITLLKTDQSLNLCEFQIWQCIPGRHGENCSIPCLSSNCSNDQCDRETGLCLACPDGLIGGLCTECIPGRHGENCSTPCLSSNCSNDQCDRETGLCLACPDGLIGGLCTVNHTETTSTVKAAEGKGDDGTGKIIGAMFGVAILITITGVAVLCWYRRSKLVAEENIEETVPKVEPTHVGNMLPNTAKQSWSAPKDESEDYEIGDQDHIYEPMRQGSNDDSSAADVNPNDANKSVSAKVVHLSSAQCDINTDYEITDCESSYDGLRPYPNVDANVEPYAELRSQDSEIRDTEQVYVNTAFAESMILKSEVLTG